MWQFYGKVNVIINCQTRHFYSMQSTPDLCSLKTISTNSWQRFCCNTKSKNFRHSLLPNWSQDNQLKRIRSEYFKWLVCYLFKVAFTRDMVEYRWKYPNPINILDIELAEFDLTSTEYTSEDVEYVAGIHHDLLQALRGVPRKKNHEWPQGFSPSFCRDKSPFFNERFSSEYFWDSSDIVCLLEVLFCFFSSGLKSKLHA